MPWIFWILSSQPTRGHDFWPSTNGKPLFQVFWFWLTYKIKLQSQQSDSHLSSETAISAITLQSSCIAVWLWRLQYDCGDCSLFADIWVWLLRLQFYCWDCRLIFVVQSDCRDRSLIVGIAVWLQISQSDCGDYSLIVDIAVWLTRLTSDCVDYSLIVEIAVWNEWDERDFWTEGQCLEVFNSCPVNQSGASILGSQPMGSLYFTSSDFDSLPKSNCNLSNRTVI